MIKITEQYYIDATNTCYTVKEKVQVKDETSKNYGEYQYRDLGYYGTIENCLNAILKTELRNFISKEQQNNLQDLLNEIKKWRTYIESLNLKI